MSILPSHFALDLLATGRLILIWLWHSTEGLVRYYKFFSASHAELYLGYSIFLAMEYQLHSASCFKY